MVVDIASTAGTSLAVNPFHEGLLSHIPIGWLQSII